MKRIILTIYYGNAIGGPKSLRFETVEQAEIYMKTLGPRVTKDMDGRYKIFTKGSTMIPCRIKEDNFI